MTSPTCTSRSGSRTPWLLFHWISAGALGACIALAVRGRMPRDPDPLFQPF